MVLRIGTRGSALARTQSTHVAEALGQQGAQWRLEIISTPGDRSQAPVERIGVGVFTQTLREALHDGRIDVAVHSFKDLPSADDPRFHLVVPQREDRRDVLVARDGLTLDTLPSGARIGTSAPRRVGQIRTLRPDLDVVPLRGNIDSRMGQIRDGRLDAVVLAAAGLNRLGVLPDASYVFDTEELLCAPAQGALAVECRADDQDTVALLNSIACPEATLCTDAERGVLRVLQAGCTAPIGASATIDGDQLKLTAGHFDPDGVYEKVSVSGCLNSPDTAERLAELVGAHLTARGLNIG